MRGAWRPFLTYGAIPFALLPLFALGEQGLTWAVALGVLGGAAPLVVLVAVLGRVRAGSFLRGLDEAGEVLAVERDEVDWWGDRRVEVRGMHGTWRIEGVTGKHSRVMVQGPGDPDPWSVSWVERAVARASVQRVAGGGAAEPPPKSVTPARMVAYTACFYATIVFLGLVFGGRTGAFWTAVATAPLFAWLAWKILARGRSVLQDSSGRVIDP